jgi:hypothetical protein
MTHISPKIKIKKVFFDKLMKKIQIFCSLQKIQFYTDVEQIAAIGIQCAESGHNTECSYVLVGIKNFKENQGTI